MIDPAQAALVWRDVVRTPVETSHALGLAGGAAGVLARVGVPASAEPLFAAVPLRPVTSGPGAGTIQFGTDLGSVLCVRPPDGAVLSVTDAAGTVRRVNADLASFVEFLLRTCRARDRFPELADDQIDRSVDLLRIELGRIDPSAFDDPDHWWALIFEQLSDGLL